MKRERVTRIACVTLNNTKDLAASHGQEKEERKKKGPKTIVKQT